METTPLIPTLIAAVVLAGVHLVVPKLRFLDGTPRSIWLSIAGGVSVAYVFIHLLPELAAGQETVARAVGPALGYLDHHVYLIALLGLTVFYGLERLAKESRRHHREAGEGDETDAKVFWIHIVSFGVYNGLIGYLLLHLEKPGLLPLVLFTVAMALHFVVTDHGLEEDHKATYRHVGRWILAAAVLAGWGLGSLTEIPELGVVVLVAFLAGGVILNVLKEEVPRERQSRFWALAVGIVGYTAVLLAL